MNLTPHHFLEEIILVDDLSEIGETNSDNLSTWKVAFFSSDT